MEMPPLGKSAGHSSAKASEGKSELGSSMLSKLLPFEKLVEPSNETSELATSPVIMKHILIILTVTRI